MDAQTKTYLFLGTVAGGVIYYFIMNRPATSEVTPSGSYQNPYTIDPNYAAAFGHGQNPDVGPAPAHYPSDPFDSLFVQAGLSNPAKAGRSTAPTAQARYANTLFQNANLTQKALGLPFFTGYKGNSGNVVVYDPLDDNTYNWDPATNSVVS
jgi:hypothetical protein